MLFNNIKLRKRKLKKIKFFKPNKIKQNKTFFNFGEYKRIYSDRAKPINYALKFSIKSILIISLFLILLLLKSSKLKIQLTDNYNISSDKWIVMNAFNPPTDSIIELEKVIKDWKIVVIGNIKTNDTNWEIFKNSNKLIYLSLKSQNTLGYEILNYIPEDSYKRKNIGYLFAIQHGAKEIYELDENLDISIENFNLDYDIKHNQLCYVNQNEGIMVNPYPHFGETNIWPRGFLLKDMRANHNNSFYYAHSRQIQSKPLVYQGLINKIPDIDPLFIQINSKLVGHLDIKFSNNYPLLYLPNNYVPINSKNTKYFYELFPFLMLPIGVNDNFSDILRGYLIEKITYEYGGAIVFHNSKAYNENEDFLKNNITEERDLLYNLQNILDIIKSNNYYYNNPINLFLNILKKLINKNFLKNDELLIYKAFLSDLNNIWYVLPSEFFKRKINNYNNILNVSSELKFYMPSNPNILNGNKTFQIRQHSSTTKVYNDILLIINFNWKGFLNLNEYLEKLYKKYFPNIVYLYPENPGKKSENIIVCKESNGGFYSYKCIRYVYSKFPNYKGYLLINDDDYMKVWELENLDFNIPWFYIYEDGELNWSWMHFNKCKNLYGMMDNNLEWKKNITKFYGKYKLVNGFSDLYYVPNYYMKDFIKLLDEMYKSKIFLECSIHTSFGILLAPKYQVFDINAIWADEREYVLKHLYKDFEQISIHPIKFSNEKLRNGVDKYISFVNAYDY